MDEKEISFFFSYSRKNINLHIRISIIDLTVPFYNLTSCT